MSATVTISPKLVRFIDELVKYGKFSNREEAVNDALEKHKQEVEWLREELAPSLRSLDRGEYAEFTAEDIIGEGKDRLLGHKAR